MANNFTFYSPTEVVFGRGVQTEAGAYIKKYNGNRVLIVYQSDEILKNGFMDEILRSLKEEGIFFEFLGGVLPNPYLSKVYEGIEVGKRLNLDFILAVGGGPVIDTAKAIAYGLAEPETDVWTLFEHIRTAKKCLPIGSVITNIVAGSETSKETVITNERTREKRAYGDSLARLKFAIMNPERTLTLSDHETQSGCVDIMMHTMERYFTNGGNMEITDVIAEGLLKTVMKNAKILHQDPQNYEARAEIMWAGSLSHNNLTGCGNNGGDFATHMLEHEVGGMFDVTNGAGLAAIWPHWARYVYKHALPRFTRFALEVMNVEAKGDMEEIALKGIEAMEEFYHSIGMPTNFKELGIYPTDEQLNDMAARCAWAAGGLQGSAKILFKKDMYEIYKMANSTGR